MATDESTECTSGAIFFIAPSAVTTLCRISIPVSQQLCSDTVGSDSSPEGSKLRLQNRGRYLPIGKRTGQTTIGALAACLATNTGDEREQETATLFQRSVFPDTVLAH
jgi:hypothetical protein